MKKLQLLTLLFLLGNGTTNKIFSQVNAWDYFLKDSTVSTLDGAIQYFYYYKSVGSEKQPLIVSLHQWSSDYSTFKNSLAPETKAKNWNYIRPDFRGTNTHVKACGSKYVIADIDEAIDWAVENLPVDTTRIYIVGASGGGYTALCHFMKSRHKVKEYSVWVPISDLKRWYFESESRNLKYATDIIRCTCEDCNEINMELALERSPLYWETPVNKLDDCKLKLHAGIHDGYTGSVSIIHSILFYNKIVKDSGGVGLNLVSDDEIMWMLTTRTAPSGINGKISDRKIHYKKTYRNISLTIFEGGHELLIGGVSAYN